MAEQANYQGEHVGLSLNRDAVFALNDALEQLRFSVADRASAAVPLRLPDGRTLQLRLSLNDAGEIRDANGDYLDDDGVAHGDVTGDLAAHVEARMVLDAAARPGLAFDLTREQLDGEAPVDSDQVAARRVDAAVAALPYRYGRSEAWVEQLRARALQVARAELPEVLDRQQAFRRQVLTNRGVGAEAADPAPRPPATTAEDEQRYAYRGLTLAGSELVERLIGDGLASPAARDDAVDEVVFQVVEANAVDFDDPVDAHAFPRKLSDPLDDPRAQRGLPEAVTRPEQPQAAVNDDAQPALKPPARLRNRFDDDRRAEVEQARQRRGYAVQAAADGRDSHAGYWVGQADRWDEYAQQSRTAAIVEDDRDRADDPDGYAQRLTAARAHDDARAAGSDGRSGEAEAPSWVTAAEQHARQAGTREAEAPSWVTAAGEHARQANARDTGRTAGSDSRSAGAGMAM